MTAAGIAFIAGGLATLISFRAVLFGAGERGRARRAARADRPSRRSQPHALPPAPGDAPDRDEQPGTRSGRGRGSRRRSLVAAGGGRSRYVDSDVDLAVARGDFGHLADADDDRDDRSGGLASIGLAAEDEDVADDLDGDDGRRMATPTWTRPSTLTRTGSSTRSRTRS